MRDISRTYGSARNYPLLSGAITPNARVTVWGVCKKTISFQVGRIEVCYCKQLGSKAIVSVISWSASLNQYVYNITHLSNMATKLAFMQYNRPIACHVIVRRGLTNRILYIVRGH